MSVRLASCRCGALTAECAGEPLRVSVCHCRECQRRTGSAFSAQARFPASAVTITGAFNTFARTGDAGSNVVYQFCPACGATIGYHIDVWPDSVAIPLGAFGGAHFPAPVYSIYERRMHPWIAIMGDQIVHAE